MNVDVQSSMQTLVAGKMLTMQEYQQQSHEGQVQPAQGLTWGSPTASSVVQKYAFATSQQEHMCPRVWARILG